MQQIMDTEGDEYAPLEETPEPLRQAQDAALPPWAELKRAYDALQVAYDELLEKNKKLRFRLQTIEGIARDDDDE